MKNRNRRKPKTNGHRGGHRVAVKRILLRVLARVTLEPGEIVVLHQAQLQERRWADLIEKGDLEHVAYVWDETAFFEAMLPPGACVIQPVARDVELPRE